jgi:Zn-dependent M28 family amino/carboxypeptidase
MTKPMPPKEKNTRALPRKKPVRGVRRSWFCVAAVTVCHFFATFCPVPKVKKSCVTRGDTSNSANSSPLAPALPPLKVGTGNNARTSSADCKKTNSTPAPTHAAPSDIFGAAVDEALALKVVERGGRKSVDL